MHSCAFVAVSSPPPDIPTHFAKAWDHSDPDERKKWHESIRTELEQMTKKKLWAEVDESLVPKERTKIGTQWVFDIKKGGRYRARLVALGFQQEKGIDYNALYSRLVSDVGIRVLLLAHLNLDLDLILLDVKAAFLESPLDDSFFLRLT